MRDVPLAFSQDIGAKLSKALDYTKAIIIAIIGVMGVKTKGFNFNSGSLF